MTKECTSEENKVEWFLRSGEPVSHKSLHSINLKKQTASYSYIDKCYRCGGEGGSNAWKHTGWTCYKCGGSGRGPQKTVKAYTEAKLSKLNASLEKRQAKAAVKRAAKEQERIDALKEEWEAWCVTHKELISNIRSLASESDFLTSLVEQIDSIHVLTDKQLSAAQNFINGVRKAKAAKEAEMKSEWVGEVGERREFTITVNHTVNLSGYNKWSNLPEFRMLYICDDEVGNRIIYTGSSSLFPEKGESVTIKATVKEHSVRDDVKQTIIKRPAAAKN